MTENEKDSCERDLKLLKMMIAQAIEHVSRH